MTQSYGISWNQSLWFNYMDISPENKMYLKMSNMFDTNIEFQNCLILNEKFFFSNYNLELYHVDVNFTA